MQKSEPTAPAPTASLNSAGAATCSALKFSASDRFIHELRRRVDAGEAIQPAWTKFLERVSERYGLPTSPRVRSHAGTGPLATLVVAYRS